MSSIYYWKEMLPSGWEVVPLKAIASYSVSSVDKIIKEEELPVELCNYTDVYKNDFITSSLEFMKGTATEEEISKYKVEIGDVIITKDSESWDDIAIPALVKETKSNLVCGYHLSIIKAHEDKILPAFLFYCLQSKDIRIQLELASTGVTRYGLPKDEIGRASLPLPNIELQNKIASYVDTEIAAITKLTDAKNNLLYTLSEKRRSLITEAVTKGINPKVKFKDLGIDWLGEIPEHWKVERTKWLFRERNKRSQTGEEELLTVSHITGVTPRSEKDVNMFEAETTEGYKIVHKDDLVINTLWAWMGAMGVAPVDGIVSPAYHVYEPSEMVLPGYIDAIVRMPIFAKEVTKYSKGVWSSRLRLYPEGFYEVYLPVPPLQEQEDILEFIQAEQRKIDEMSKVTSRSIELLKERRISLITAAVTGQIQIP